MRTKALLCAAALAAGALTSMAQVYSANVVGYVNVTITGGSSYNLIANPLDATMGGTVPNANNITNLFVGTTIHASDKIYRWDQGSQDFLAPPSLRGPSAWNNPFDLTPGEGVMYVTASASVGGTLTFVGQVNQGLWTYPGNVNSAPNSIMGHAAYNYIGGGFPLGGSFTNTITGIVPHPSDKVFTWDVGTQDYSAVVPLRGPSSWNHTDVTVAPGVGMVYVSSSSSPDQVWTATFTVQ